MNVFEGVIREKMIDLKEENEKLKEEILSLREAFKTMKLLAIPKYYVENDYLSSSVLEICDEALKDTEKYVKSEVKDNGD